MDDKLLRKLSRQLRWLNIVVTFFGVVTLGAIIFVGFLLFQILSFVNETRQNIETTQQNFDIERQVCDGEGSFSDFIREQTTACR